jgi:hypothetical protein
MFAVEAAKYIDAELEQQKSLLDNELGMKITTKNNIP